MPHIRLDERQWVLVDAIGIPLLMVPISWEELRRYVEASPPGIEVMGLHNDTGITLTRRQIVKLPRPPNALEVPECPQCHLAMKLVVGRYGVFFGCPSYPKCMSKANVFRCLRSVRNANALSGERGLAETEGNENSRSRTPNDRD